MFFSSSYGRVKEKVKVLLSSENPQYTYWFPLNLSEVFGFKSVEYNAKKLDTL